MANSLSASSLGRTGLEVTRLGYGAMAVRDVPEDVADTVLNAVLDAGINFIDTSNDYGRSEEFIGKYVSQRRSEYHLAIKCGCRQGGGEHIWTRENLFRGLNESLERLNTDSVDLMQLHNAPVEDCEQGDLVEALQEMKSQGKVRWIAISTTLPHLPTYLDWGVFDQFQIPDSVFRTPAGARGVDHEVSRGRHRHGDQGWCRSGGARSGARKGRYLAKVRRGQAR